MAKIDLEALRARLKAQAAVKLTDGVNDENTKMDDAVSANSNTGVSSSSNNDSRSNTSREADKPSGTASLTLSIPVAPATPVPTVSAPAILGTAKTTEIDHLDFLSKMNRLAEAIHTKHPTMPVLLMQIHKQLRADPELVTTLDEDAIGIVVSGLQVVTKTELVSVALKESKTKAKKLAISADMF